MPDTGHTFAHGQTRFYRAPAATDIELERLIETLIQSGTVVVGIVSSTSRPAWYPKAGADRLRQ